MFIYPLCSHHAIDHSLFFLYFAAGFLSSFFFSPSGHFLAWTVGAARRRHHVEGLAFMRTTTPVLGLHLVAVCDDATAALVNPTAWSRIEVSRAIPGDHLLCRRLCQHSVWDGPTARLQRGILTQDVMDDCERRLGYYPDTKKLAMAICRTLAPCSLPGMWRRSR